jgi:D-alanyl-D-alanine carboxypeptidase (penicillin-binding protein 5/6)
LSGAGRRLGTTLVALAAVALAAPARPAEPLAAAPPAEAPDRFPRAGAAYLVVRDGALLWARNPDAPLPPASLTKLMTALLAAEHGAPDGWITVSARAARETGAHLGLRPGERLRAGDALAAALVASANDACLALAEHVGGSAEGFVDAMNRRAAALGLAATRFENPCGHDAPGHRASARDLLALTRAVLAVPALREVVARERIEIVTKAGRRLVAPTRNSLLGRVRGLTGVKTGTTEAAGRCVIARAEREGSEVVVVLLDAPDRWFTAAALVEAAFRERPRG